MYFSGLEVQGNYVSMKKKKTYVPPSLTCYPIEPLMDNTFFHASLGKRMNYGSGDMIDQGTDRIDYGSGNMLDGNSGRIDYGSGSMIDQGYNRFGYGSGNTDGWEF